MRIKIPKNEKFIMAQPDAGLGNRLRCMYSWIYYADYFKVPLDVLWLRETCCNVRYEELFKKDENVRVHTLYKLGYKNKYVLKSLASSVVFKRLKKKVKYFDAGKSTAIFENSGEKGFIDILKQSDAVCFKSCNQNCDGEHFIASRNRIEPAEDIKTRVDEILFEYTSKRLVGIHIRRTDHVDAIEHSTLEAFVKAMRKEADEGACFYIATDDADVERQLNEEFECVPHKNFCDRKSRNTAEGMKDAYVDMLCLSRCEKIYGSYGSSFSVMASIMGDVTLEIV